MFEHVMGWHLQLFLSMDRRWQVEVGLTERMFQAKGAGGTKARRQEGKGHVSSGNEGNPIRIEHEGVGVRSAGKGELGCLGRGSRAEGIVGGKCSVCFGRCRGVTCLG